MNFDKTDYLVIGPYCWGRAKSLAEALWEANKNKYVIPNNKKDPYFRAYRLSDEVDQVQVDPFGSFSWDKGTVLDLGYFNFNRVPVDKK